MDGSSYAALREKNIQEKLLKLEEMGVDPSKFQQEGTKKRIRKDFSSNEDDDWAPSKRQSGRGRGRNRAPSYDWNSDDTDFDADNPDNPEASEDLQGSKTGGTPVERSEPESLKRGRGRPGKVKRAQKGGEEKSSESVDVDVNLFCDECGRYHEGNCPVHGPLTIVADTPVPCNPKDETRARKTAPLEVRVGECKTKNGGNKVWAKNFIPARTRFGPFQGQIISKDFRSGPFIWEIKRNGKILHCVDASDPGVSNWMRYVGFARNDGEQNINAYQYQGEIYFRTTKDIEAHEELLVWKDNAHGRQLEDKKDKPAKTESRPATKSYKCPGCGIAYISQDYVDRHAKTCRKLRNNECADKIFKCISCQCAYSSLEYLERHRKVCRKMEKNENTGEMFKCIGCKCAYASEDYLERHKKICRELGSKKQPHEVFSCPGCKCAYSAQDYLDRHQKICRQLEPQKVLEDMHKCTACQTAYADPKYLERHKKTCRQMVLTRKAGIPINFECSACHSVYTNEMFLERHKKVCVGTETNYFSELKCSTCPRSFADQTLLNRHKMTCENLAPSLQAALKEDEEEERRIFENDSDGDIKKIPNTIPLKENGCCEVQRASPFVVLKRISWFDPLFHGTTRFNDVSSKPLKCPDCNERFIYKARLDNHRLIHLRQTLNVCLECDKVFCNKKLYADHVKLHG